MSIESLEHMVRNKVRLFLRHTWLVTVCGTLALVGAIWAGFYFTIEADHMRIAAGPVDQKFVQALSNQIANGHHDLTLQIVPTTGAKETAEAISKGQADLAILPSNLDDSLNWPVIAILRQNVMALIVPAPAAAAAPAKTATSAKASKTTKTSSDKTSKGAKSSKSAKNDDIDDSDSGDDSGGSDKFGKVSQLSGKRVGVVTGNEATTGLLELVLSHYGVALAKVTISQIDPNNLADVIKNNQVDALFVAGAATGRAISSTVAAATQNGKAPTFIEIDQADGIAKRNPGFDSIDIDAGTFGGNPPSPSDDLKSLSFGEYMVARRSYSESVIDTLSKVLYSSRQALATALPGEIKIAAPSTDKDADVVVHAGAMAYLSDSQQSFFDKYGDDIFYGMLIFPVFGHGGITGLAASCDNAVHDVALGKDAGQFSIAQHGQGADIVFHHEASRLQHGTCSIDRINFAILHNFAEGGHGKLLQRLAVTERSEAGPTRPGRFVGTTLPHAHAGRRTNTETFNYGEGCSEVQFLA